MELRVAAPARLDGRVALVTGASSGIGAACAAALAAEGAHVVAAARRVEALERLVAGVAAAGGAGEALRLDVTAAADVADAVAGIEARHGRLDLLVNSAGVLLSARVRDAALADWRTMFEINLLGAMNVTRAALPLMLRGDHGHVITISSVSSRMASAGSPAYAATKSGLNAFSESLRKECAADGLRVTTVLPGLVETELFEHLTDASVRARFDAMRESVEALAPEDVAEAVVYAATRAPRVSVSEIVIRPTKEL